MNIKRVFIVILAIVLIAVILIGFSRPWIFKMEYETSNPNDYKKCLNLVNHLDGVNDIFPKDVPSDAMDIVWIIAFVVFIMRYRSNKDK